MTNLTEEQVQALDSMIQRQNEILDINRSLEQHMQAMEQQHRQQIIDLGTEIHDYIANNVVLKSQHYQSSSLRLKPPTPFSGNPSYCDSFFVQLSLIFAADELRFNSDRTKILYAINCLSGSAFNFMQPYIKNMDEKDQPQEIFTSYAHFKKVIKTTFGDTNPVVNAEAEIRLLKQTGPAAIYATEFRRISMQLTWNNDALVSQYMLNLKENIKDELARRDPIQDLTILLNASIDINNRLFHRQKQKNTSSNRPSNHHSRTTNDVAPST
ncbi:hypothetical protein INT47_011476 [Mucor saturninus]|uniref:Ty3 transposon capsid-like protein domain-containing protein n=1 Tax=Mucor saturninus TaxID=64648 RepID=A0A8H7UUG4_9FUNG|nr:hypothetical protein INT47_011476 [Mucor saturninus]